MWIFNNPTAAFIVDVLSESRLLPHAVLAHRGAQRIAFLKEIGIKGGVGAEIGVQKGFFSHVLLKHIQPTKLHLMDPWYLIGEQWPWAIANKSTCKALRNILYWFQSELADGRIILDVGFDDQY